MTEPEVGNEQPESRDGSVKVQISPSKMEVFLSVTAPLGAGRVVTPEDCLSAVRQTGVVAPVDAEACADALTQAMALQGWTPSPPVTAARGTPAEAGRDAEIRYSEVLELTGGVPNITLDDRADFFDLGLVRNVEAGTVLAHRQPPTEGIPGLNVMGEPVPAKPGKDQRLRAGKGCRISEDGLTVVAEVNGHATRDTDDKITVSPIFTVKEDVGAATGNIEFVGTVVVKGSVHAGYVVKAAQNVEIHGGVDGGVVECGGNVSVKYGVVGGHRGRVSAGGSVRSRFVENAEIRAGGDVLIQDGILHSQVGSGGRVLVAGRRAAIIGGRIQARDEITARVLGSGQNIVTEVEVGVDPVLRDRRGQVRKDLQEAEDALTKAGQFVKLLRDQEATAGGAGLPLAKQEMLEKALRSLVHHRQRQEELSQQLLAIDESVAKTRTGKVQALDTAYSGVRVTIGDGQFVVTDPLVRCRFYLGDDALVQFGQV